MTAHSGGGNVCLREVTVTCGTYADPAVLEAAHVLCLRPLPCDNPHHKPETPSASGSSMSGGEHVG